MSIGQKSISNVLRRKNEKMPKRDSGKGQYDLEYAACPCFWGKDPAKYVRLFAERYLRESRGRVLDIGAGEGKNSLFLAAMGVDVVAVEVSRLACRNFLERMIEEETSERVTMINADATQIDGMILGQFDAIVSYGYLHCLENEDSARASVEKSQAFTKVGGFNIVSAFTDKLPVPAIQDYLSPTLLDADRVKEWYSNWDIVEYEEDIITESHPTTNEEHCHSLFRMIARKIA